MKILQLNSVYKEGSTGKIVDCIGKALRDQGHEVYTLYGNGKEYYDVHSKKICSSLEHNINAAVARITGIPFGGLYYSNQRIYNIIQSYQPDVVHVHCVNGFCMNVYKLFKYLAKHGIKTVVSLHAEIFYTAGCSHAFDCKQWKTKCRKCPLFKKDKLSGLFDTSKLAWKKMYDAFNCFKQENLIITAVSPWLADRASQSSILKNYRTVYVPNGLDTSVFYHRDNKSIIDRGNFKKVALFVTPMFSHSEYDIKGGRYIPMIAEALPEYKFIVVASRVVEPLKLMPNNVQLWGRAKSQDELAQLYSEADVTLLLSRRETFSMVTAESLCCGTPIVGFKAGGPESIALKENSFFVDYGDVNSIISKLSIVTNRNVVINSEKAIKAYSCNIMTNLFFEIYRNLIDNE